jgi:hypothetical protein
MRKDALDATEKERFFAEIEILKHLVSKLTIGSPSHCSFV